MYSIGKASHTESRYARESHRKKTTDRTCKQQQTRKQTGTSTHLKHPHHLPSRDRDVPRSEGHRCPGKLTSTRGRTRRMPGTSTRHKKWTPGTKFCDTPQVRKRGQFWNRFAIPKIPFLLENPESASISDPKPVCSFADNSIPGIAINWISVSDTETDPDFAAKVASVVDAGDDLEWLPRMPAAGSSFTYNSKMLQSVYLLGDDGFSRKNTYPQRAWGTLALAQISPMAKRSQHNLITIHFSDMLQKSHAGRDRFFSKLAIFLMSRQKMFSERGYIFFKKICEYLIGSPRRSAAHDAAAT